MVPQFRWWIARGAAFIAGKPIRRSPRALARLAAAVGEVRRGRRRDPQRAVGEVRPGPARTGIHV